MALTYALLVIIYHVLKNQVPYHELGADYFDKINMTHIKRHHIRRLEDLEFKVILEPLEKAAEEQGSYFLYYISNSGLDEFVQCCSND